MIEILNGIQQSECGKPDQRNQEKYQALEWKPATREPRCLICHALAPDPGQRDRDFNTEGVGCESCHGASSGWFKQHFESSWKTENCSNPQYRMTCIRDAAVRSSTCLDCHLGAKDRQVDHKMIAAGHPDLFFEVDLFSAKETPHWKKPDDPNYGVRLWAVGQAVQLQKALERLATRAEQAQAPGFLQKGGQWPEFSELDCFSCHHGVNTNWRQPDQTDQLGSLLRSPESWRQNRGYYDRTAGSPPWNSAHYSLLGILMEEVDPKGSDDLKSKLNQLYQAVSRLNSRPEDVRQKATDAAVLASGFVFKVNKSFTQPALARLLLNITAQSRAIANQDTRSAEQAYMALDSIFRCYEKIPSGQPLESAPDKGVAIAINDLYREFDNPSSFDGPRFARGLDRVHAELIAAHIGTPQATSRKPPSPRNGGQGRAKGQVAAKRVSVK